MAEAWNSWGTAEDNNTEGTGWAVDEITTSIYDDPGNNYERNQNKSNFARNSSPPPGRGENSHGNRNNMHTYNRYGNEKPNNRGGVTNDGHKNIWTEQNRGNRNENFRGGRNNGGNFSNDRPRHYNREINDSQASGSRQQDFQRGPTHGAQNKYVNNRGGRQNIGPRFTNKNRSDSESSAPTQQSFRPHENDFNRKKENFNRNRSKSGNRAPFKFDNGRDHKREGDRKDGTMKSNNSNRPHASDFKKLNQHFNQSRSKSQNRGSFNFENKTDQPKPFIVQEKNENSANRNNMPFHEPSKNYNNSKRGSTDFGNNRRDNSNQQDQKAVNFYDPISSRRGASQNTNWKNECIVKDFAEPPQLINVEDVENELDNSVLSSKISTRSESVTSSDPHEIETTILKMVHDFKATVFALDTKPSRLVQNEIKSLQKYISLILEKWNPKSKEDGSSLDSESSDSSSTEEEETTKKRKKKNRKKKNKGKDIEKMSEDGGKKMEQKNQNLPRMVDNNVKQFQENSVNLLNQHSTANIGVHQHMPMHGRLPLLQTPMYPHPHMMMPPFPMPAQNNAHWQMQQNHTSPMMHMNHTNMQTSKPTHLQKSQPKAFVKPRTNSPVQRTPSKSKSNQPVLKNVSVWSNKVQSIFDEITISDVIMTKSDIKELKAALSKLSLVDNRNYTKADQGQIFEVVNICMVKIVENDTLPIDIKFNIFHQLEVFFNNTCDEKTGGSLKKLLNIYDTALNDLKKTTIEYNDKYEKNYELLKKISKDSNIFFFPKKENKLFAFKDVASEAMGMFSTHSITTAGVDSTTAAEDNPSESEDSSDDSSDDNEDASDGEDNINKGKDDATVSEEKQVRDKKPAHETFIEELDIHCKLFLSSEQNIEDQVNHLLATYEKVQSGEHKSKERKLMYIIKDLVNRLYPQCILHLYGSRLSNMALPDSDMDIYIDITCNGYFNCTSYENQQTFVKKLKRVFFQRSDCFSNILALIKTRVPIIKLYHRSFAINCDISFKSGISVENTKLLLYYLSIDTRVKWLATAVKLWAQFNHIYGSDYFTSHGLCWLVLFYLMRLKIVPPVSDLKQNAPPRFIDNWNISFKKLDDWVPAIPSTSRLTLFKDFFSFLKEPILKNCVLCTFTGEFIPKATVENLDLLENYKDGIFKEYVLRMRNAQTDDSFAKENPSSVPMPVQEDQLCIQDPFEFSKNVANPVRQKKFTHFFRVCHLTLQQLESCE